MLCFESLIAVLAVSLNSVALKTWGEWTTTIEATRTRLVLELSEDDSQVLVSAMALERVIGTLITNAREAIGTREGGRITIRTARRRVASGEHAVLQVTNNWCSVNDDVAESVAAFARDASAHVIAESSVVEGTTFSIWFPAYGGGQ